MSLWQHWKKIAHGEYCWLFGSDDVMKHGAISKILNVI